MITCPFCNAEMLEHDMNDRTWYSCSNPNCKCGDGGMTFYGKPWPLRKIESKRKQVERKPVKHLLSAITLTCLICGAAFAQQSPLATLANSMQPGTWAELQTTGMLTAFTGTAGSSGIINPYGMTMVRDSQTGCSYYFGSDHGGNYSALWPNSSGRFVRYCESTNTWTILPKPPWYTHDANEYTDAHGYHLIAINVAGRELYRMPYGRDSVHVFDLDTLQWKPDLPLAPGGMNQVIGTIDFFPERNALMYSGANGGIYEYRKAANQWFEITPPEMANLANNAWLASTWQWVNCHPGLHECWFGSSTNRHWRYKADGTWQRMQDIPLAYRTYNGSGSNGIWIATPDGKYTVMTDPTNGTGRNMFSFDPATETYTPLPAPPDKHLNNSTNWLAVPIPEHNVSMWLFADGSGSPSAKVFLFKHGGSTPPAENLAPSVNAGADITVYLPCGGR